MNYRGGYMTLVDNPLAGRSSGDLLVSHTLRDGRITPKIGLIGRLLLTSDGTITAMLEQLSGEQIVTARLHQSDGTGGPGDHRTHVVASCQPGDSHDPPGWGHLGPGFRAGEVGVLGEHHAPDGAC